MDKFEIGLGSSEVRCDGNEVHLEQRAVMSLLRGYDPADERAPFISLFSSVSGREIIDTSPGGVKGQDMAVAVAGNTLYSG